MISEQYVHMTTFKESLWKCLFYACLDKCAFQVSVCKTPIHVLLHTFYKLFMESTYKIRNLSVDLVM